MKKVVLAAAAAAFVPLLAGAAAPSPESPAHPPPTEAPARLVPKTTYGDTARVVSSRAVYERTPHLRRECRLDKSGYSSTAAEIERCDDIADTGERIVAYDVTYEYNGREFQIRMPYEPGERIAVNVDVRPPLPRPQYNPRPRYRGPY